MLDNRKSDQDVSSDKTQVYVETEEDVTLPHIEKNTPAGEPVLKVIKGHSAGIVFALDPSGVTTIGRDTDCSIFLNNTTVSRLHATITQKDDRLFLEDNNSLNGTWVNGAIVTNTELHDEDIIQVGTFVLALDK